MIISDLRDKHNYPKLYAKVVEYQQGKDVDNSKMKLNASAQDKGFAWDATDEGWRFWNSIICCEFDEAKAKYPEFAHLFERDGETEQTSHEFKENDCYKIVKAPNRNTIGKIYIFTGKDLNSYKFVSLRDNLTYVVPGKTLLSGRIVFEPISSVSVKVQSEQHPKNTEPKERKLLHPDSVLVKAEQHQDKHLHELIKIDKPKPEPLGTDWHGFNQDRER